MLVILSNDLECVGVVHQHHSNDERQQLKLYESQLPLATYAPSGVVQGNGPRVRRLDFWNVCDTLGCFEQWMDNDGHI